MEIISLAGAIALMLGLLLMAFAFLAALLTIVGIVLALIFFKTRQIVIPGLTLFILNLLETPIRYLLWVFRVEEDVVSKMMIEVRNLLYTPAYNKTEYSERMIFLPQCLRHPNCPAPLTPEGIKCMSCGRCGIGALKEEAQQLGYMFFIAPGSSLIKRMVKKYQPKAVLGAGCHMEVKEGTGKMASYGLPVQGILLERDGCVDTRIDVVKLMEKIKSKSMKKGKYCIEEDEKAFMRAREISRLWRQEDEVDVEILNHES